MDLIGKREVGKGQESVRYALCTFSEKYGVIGDGSGNTAGLCGGGSRKSSDWSSPVGLGGTKGDGTDPALVWLALSLR